MKRYSVIAISVLSIFILASCAAQQSKPVTVPSNISSPDSSQVSTLITPGVPTEGNTAAPPLNSVEADPPKSFALSEGGYQGKHQYGYFLFQDDAAFLFGEEAQTIYQIKNGKSLKLFGPQENRLYLGGLCEQNGFLYYKNQQDLYRIPADGGDPELLLDKIGDFDVFANIIYVTSKNGDSGLFAVDNNDISHAAELSENASIIAAVEGGIIYRVSGAGPKTNELIYYHQSNGKRTILDLDLYGKPFEVHGDEIYYRDTVNCGDDTGYYGRICLYNYKTGDEHIIYSQENADRTMWGIQNFTLNDHFLYMYEGRDVSVFTKFNLNSGEYTTIMDYVNLSDYTNGVIDLIHLFSIAADENYVYLYGKAYANGYFLTTRFAIEGAPEGKQEEVFYEGRWIPAKEYYDLDE